MALELNFYGVRTFPQLSPLLPFSALLAALKERKVPPNQLIHVFSRFRTTSAAHIDLLDRSHRYHLCRAHGLFPVWRAHRKLSWHAALIHAHDEHLRRPLSLEKMKDEEVELA